MKKYLEMNEKSYKRDPEYKRIVYALVNQFLIIPMIKLTLRLDWHLLNFYRYIFFEHLWNHISLEWEDCMAAQSISPWFKKEEISTARIYEHIAEPICKLEEAAVDYDLKL